MLFAEALRETWQCSAHFRHTPQYNPRTSSLLERAHSMATYRQLYTYRVLVNGTWIASKSSRAAAQKIVDATPGATLEEVKGNVQAIIRRKGFKPVSGTFPNLTQAKRWASIQEGKVADGTFKDAAIYSRMTVAALMQRYEQLFTAGKQSARQERTSLKNIYRLLGHRLIPVTGTREGELSRADIRGYVKTRRDEGVLSETIRKELNPLSNCLNIAPDAWDDIPDLINVVQKTKAILKATKELLPGNKRERRVWQEEINAILGPGLRSFYAPRAFQWAYNTGMRRSEICQALLFETWFDVVDVDGAVVFSSRAYLRSLDKQLEDPEDLRLVARPQRNRKYFNAAERTLYLPSEITKTDKERYVYLTDEALEVLQQLPSSTDGRLFVTMPDTLTNWLARRTASLGIEDLRWHDTRHEALSRFAEMKWGIVQISAISGHQDFETLQRYLHPSNIHVERDSITGRLKAA